MSRGGTWVKFSDRLNSANQAISRESLLEVGTIAAGTRPVNGESVFAGYQRAI